MEHATEGDCKQNVDYMLKLLNMVASTTFFSKLLIEDLPEMLSNSDQVALQFFENAIYKSLYMEIPVCLEQIDQEEEYIFTSHTSIIDTKIILENFPD